MLNNRRNRYGLQARDVRRIRGILILRQARRALNKVSG